MPAFRFYYTKAGDILLISVNTDLAAVNIFWQNSWKTLLWEKQFVSQGSF